MRQSTWNFNIPPPPWQTPGIWTFEDWIVQIPTPSGQNGVQMPYPIVRFVSYPTKEKLFLAPVVFNKDLFCKPIAHNCYISSF